MKKQIHKEKILIIERKKVVLLHILKILGAILAISSLFIPALYTGLAILLLLVGILLFLCSGFARDYYLRCPNCGEILLKKKNKFKGKFPKGCPKCSWAVKIENR